MNRVPAVAMDWGTAAYWMAAHIRAAAGAVGVTGFGVGLVKFLRHAPAPKKDSVWAGCLFDTFQDLASNDSRIGERRGEAAGAMATTHQPAAPPP